nr:WRKY [Loropetalum chinense var. rubrum]
MAEKDSFEALQLKNPKPEEEHEEEDEDEDEYEEEEEEEEVSEEEEDDEEEEERVSELHSSIPSVKAEFRDSQSETLTVPSSIPLSETDHQANFAAASSSQLLAGFPVNSTPQSLGADEFKEHIEVSHQEVLASITTQAAEAQSQNQIQLSRCPTSSSELSPTSFTQSILSASSSTLVERRLSLVPKENSECKAEVNQQNSSVVKSKSAVPGMKTPSADGYNWRKYGQKQVKSPKGSRSYYKCTYSDCYAKKIECCDHAGHVIEIIYKGRHNHEPPRKVNNTRENRLASCAGSVVGNGITSHPIRMLNDSDPSTPSKETIQDASPTPERKRHNSSDSDGNAEIKVKEEKAVEPEPKRRLKKSSSVCSGSVFKPGKKPKFVVHAAGDVGISSDGYRWRKYGQKMVKGNPHPRNYYRCTSAGCPVRKHIENAIDNTSAVIITYKGIHDHDMPVPKKRHGPPSAHLVAAAAPASMNNLQFKRTDSFQNQIPSTQWSVDMEGELTGEALDLGGEKAMESARTLLSIGFEIKPC